MLDDLKATGYEIVFESHAVAILDRDFHAALGELEGVLKDFEIPITEIIGSGGGETKGTQRLRRALDAQGWRKTIFEISAWLATKRRGPGGFPCRNRLGLSIDSKRKR